MPLIELCQLDQLDIVEMFAPRNLAKKGTPSVVCKLQNAWSPQQLVTNFAHEHACRYQATWILGPSIYKRLNFT